MGWDLGFRVSGLRVRLWLFELLVFGCEGLRVRLFVGLSGFGCLWRFLGCRVKNWDYRVGLEGLSYNVGVSPASPKPRLGCRP